MYIKNQFKISLIILYCLIAISTTTKSQYDLERFAYYFYASNKNYTPVVNPMQITFSDDSKYVYILDLVSPQNSRLTKFLVLGLKQVASILLPRDVDYFSISPTQKHLIVKRRGFAPQLYFNFNTAGQKVVNLTSTKAYFMTDDWLNTDDGFFKVSDWQRYSESKFNQETSNLKSQFIVKNVKRSLFPTLDKAIHSSTTFSRDFRNNITQLYHCVSPDEEHFIYYENGGVTLAKFNIGIAFKKDTVCVSTVDVDLPTIDKWLADKQHVETKIYSAEISPLTGKPGGVSRVQKGTIKIFGRTDKLLFGIVTYLQIGQKLEPSDYLMGLYSENEKSYGLRTHPSAGCIYPLITTSVQNTPRKNNEASIANVENPDLYYFKDDFSKETYEWYIYREGEITSIITEGKYLVTSEKPFESSRSTRKFPINTEKDYKVSVVTQSRLGNNPQPYGLQLFGNADNAYMVFAITETGAFGIWMVDDNSIPWRPVKQLETSSWINHKGQTNRLSVIKIGNKFNFLINDHLVAELPVLTMKYPNYFGVRVLGVQSVEFDDFTVEGIPEK